MCGLRTPAPRLSTSCSSNATGSDGFALIRYHLAVIRQASRRHEFDRALKFDHRAQRRGDLVATLLIGERAFRFDSHRVGLAPARHDETQPSELLVALADFGDLLGP